MEFAPSAPKVENLKIAEEKIFNTESTEEDHRERRDEEPKKTG
jgi:hypothetical protein